MKFICTLLCFCCALWSNAQQFYGVSDYKGGTVFLYDNATSAIATVYKTEVQAVMPTGSLTKGADGRLYGIAAQGGAEGAGGIFVLDAFSGSYQLLYTFSQQDAGQPTGELVLAGDGKLYGLFASGGNNGNGYMFSFDPKTKVFAGRYHFDSANGSSPVGGLVMHSNGKLYGVTQAGGNEDLGVLFSFDPNTGTYARLQDFSLATGAYPATSLVLAKDGSLYGATAMGGTEDTHAGGIFRYVAATNRLSHLFYFRWDNKLGSDPAGGLTVGTDGQLYGATQRGGASNEGVLFRFNTASKTYNSLYSFATETGGKPTGNLLFHEGRLYGLTQAGNTYDNGGLFAFDIASSSYANLYALKAQDGIYPKGGLTLAGTTLYGVAPYGGADYGTLFSYNLPTAVFHTVKTFEEAPNGINPVADLTRYTDGLLYGATTGGGSGGRGVIFSFNPVTKKYQSRYRMDATLGQYMASGFTVGADGKLYGMLSTGGANSAGQIFSFDPVHNNATPVFQFSEAGGAYPDGSLLRGDDGAFYGTANSGGANGQGALFRFQPATGIFTRLLSFSGADGANPIDGLTMGAGTRLYGVTQWGGAHNLGVLYAFDPATGTTKKLYDFDGATGSNPLRRVVMGHDNKLYGTTPAGGKYNKGVLFCFDPKLGTFTVLFHFDGNKGAHPFGRLAMREDGRLYGFTQKGGISDSGIIFRYDPADGATKKLKSFVHSGTANPASAGLTQHCTSPATFYRDGDGDGFGTPAYSIQACSAPAGFVSNHLDCNDAAPSIKPGAVEICGNGVDDNCNGLVDETCTTTSRTEQGRNAPAIAEMLALSLDAYPNPSATEFRLSVKAGSTEKVSLRVLDGAGKQVEVFQNLQTGKVLTLGRNYTPGFYLVELRQGDRLVKLKLIKQGQ
ncbi:Por secretion system C-terminal sorting domain-containing protein [Cnuella takakiae]|uniref:Por secretion system C-terminal sorting domain-containing protein n=1 Tax=Cnuella takakiae TaxID=1302690 RepID=A0A1M5B367_9BACT|nr:choice-of-anchor tandem repeat GloVer-containing protein [Cnuella takakiae]OLY93311.1 hypothetical protein BUE76_16535 [Cnuella takakiae]SHF36777.1 Por secretion system C-terminal sorting domain-containing protein [Cnuella takakiae]